MMSALPFLSHGENQAPFTIHTLHRVLKDVFQLNYFKPMQLEIIQAILNNQHVFVQLRPGSGKSICYQLPALLSEGTTIVISPLIALMHDQVLALQKKKINACYLDSSLNQDKKTTTLHKILAGEYRLIYISPERFNHSYFLYCLRQLKIDRIIIDEAHCMSQWGHDFREDYLKLNRLKYILPNIPRIAITATADAHTRADIIELLHLKPVKTFVRYLPNPQLTGYFIKKNNTKQQLIDFLTSLSPPLCGIVYCSSRQQTEDIATFLTRIGYQTYLYHAGMPSEARKINQAAFQKAKQGIMVATVAFGLGIDKSDIRFVAHVYLPPSIEHYIQESGRAGRDTLPAISWVCYGLNDFLLRNEYIKNSNLSQTHKKIKVKKLKQSLAFCEGLVERDNFLRHYFDESTSIEEKIPFDIRRLQAIAYPMATVLTVMFYTQQNASLSEVIQILRGSNRFLYHYYNLEQYSIYGRYTYSSISFWRYTICLMIAADLVEVSNCGQVLRFTAHSLTFLKKLHQPLLRNNS